MAMESYELSPVQQGILSHALRAPASGEYHEQVVAELREEIDPRRLEEAWQQVIAGHPVLRSSFTWESLDGPRQVVHEAVPFRLRVLDWRTPDGRTPQQRLDALLADDRANAFDMARAPLLRACVVRLGAEHWALLLSVSRAILDTPSLATVLAEVFAAYDGDPSAPVARPPYATYIDWLRTRDHGADERYWRGALQGATVPTPLPLSLDANEPVGFGAEAASLDAATTASLVELAGRCGAGLRTVVAGAWALLLARNSDRDEVTFGLARSGRRAVPNGATMIGPFATTLPLRVVLRRDDFACEWLGAVHAAQEVTGAHEQVAPADVRRWSGVPAGRPVFESEVIYDDRSLDTRVKAHPGRWAGRRFMLHERPSCPLSLYAWGESTLHYRLVWDRARLHDQGAAEVLRELGALLRAMPRGADEPLAAFLIGPATVQRDIRHSAPALTTLTTVFPSHA